MYVAVFVYGGMINHVEINSDLDYLKDMIKQAVEQISNIDPFDTDKDIIQIWDNKGNVIFDYAVDVLGIK